MSLTWHCAQGQLWPLLLSPLWPLLLLHQGCVFSYARLCACFYRLSKLFWKVEEKKCECRSFKHSGACRAGGRRGTERDIYGRDQSLGQQEALAALRLQTDFRRKCLKAAPGVLLLKHGLVLTFINEH